MLNKSPHTRVVDSATKQKNKPIPSETLTELVFISDTVVVQMQSISSLTNARAFSTCENRVYSSAL